MDLGDDYGRLDVHTRMGWTGKRVKSAGVIGRSQRENDSMICEDDNAFLGI